jgi:hypothetical protein
MRQSRSIKHESDINTEKRCITLQGVASVGPVAGECVFSPEKRGFLDGDRCNVGPQHAWDADGFADIQI